MKRLRNVWIDNPFNEYQAKHLKKNRLQVPREYGATEELRDAEGNTVNGDDGKPLRTALTEDANTFRVLRDICYRYMQALPMDERTGRFKVERADSKHAKALLKQLAKQKNGGLGNEILEVEGGEYDWLKKLADERGVVVNLYPIVADDILEIIENPVKEADEEPKPVKVEEKKAG